MARNSDAGDILHITCDARDKIKLGSKAMPAPKFSELRMEPRHWKQDSKIRDAFYFVSQWGYLRVWDLICSNHIVFLRCRNHRLSTIKDKGKAMCSEIEPLLKELQQNSVGPLENQLVQVLESIHQNFERIIRTINSDLPNYEDLEEQVDSCTIKIGELEEKDEGNRKQVEKLLQEAKEMYEGVVAALDESDARHLAIFEKHLLLTQNIFFNRQSSLEIRLRINHRAKITLKELVPFAMLLNWNAVSLDHSFQLDRDNYNKWATGRSSMSAKSFKKVLEEIPNLQERDLQTKRMDLKFHYMLLDNTPKHKMTKKLEEEKRRLLEALNEFQEN